MLEIETLKSASENASETQKVLVATQVEQTPIIASEDVKEVDITKTQSKLFPVLSQNFKRRHVLLWDGIKRNSED